MDNQVTKPKFPTEMVELPSKGLLYSKENPLSSGQIEMKYMTAREEDILTNQNYIQQGTVLDKLLESLIVSKVDLKDIVVGDKNAILIASRILGYGQDYEFESGGKHYNVDLTTLKDKELPEDIDYTKGNNFYYTLPASGVEVGFKLLTHGDESAIESELKGLKKLYPNGGAPELSTRLKYMLTSVGGNTDRKVVREFVDNELLARDSRSLRQEIKRISPDIDLTIQGDGGEDITVPISLNFFWPDINL
jgi:hypothetical protein